MLASLPSWEDRPKVKRARSQLSTLDRLEEQRARVTSDHQILIGGDYSHCAGALRRGDDLSCTSFC